MLEGAELLAFVPSVDLGRARLFYEGRLGLDVQEDGPFALALRAGGQRLRVTRVEALTPHPFTILGWVVDDIAARVAELRGRGVDFMVYDGLDQDEDAVWTTPGGARVAWFRDSDGNTLSLTQL